MLPLTYFLGRSSISSLRNLRLGPRRIADHFVFICLIPSGINQASSLFSPSCSSCLVSSSFPITFSNCDHSASTDENSLPTYNTQPSAKLSAVIAQITYRDHGLQRPVQLVDIRKDVLEALEWDVRCVEVREVADVPLRSRRGGLHVVVRSMFSRALRLRRRTVDLRPSRGVCFGEVLQGCRVDRV